MKAISPHLLAQKYAQAFFNIFGETITEKESVNTEKASLFLRQRKGDLFYLQVPHISAEVKIDMLQVVLIKTYQLPSVYEKLIKLLVRDKRASLMGLVLKHIVALYRKQHAIMFFEITSSHSLTQDQLEDVKRFLVRETGYDIIYKYKVDNELIAGLRLQSDFFVWEYSIRKHLDSLRGIMTHN